MVDNCDQYVRNNYLGERSAQMEIGSQLEGDS